MASLCHLFVKLLHDSLVPVVTFRFDIFRHIFLPKDKLMHCFFYLYSSLLVVLFTSLTVLAGVGLHVFASICDI